ncbi:MAG: ATP-binding protein [Candidatus Omnitrophota bacterium]
MSNNFLSIYALPYLLVAILFLFLGVFVFLHNKKSLTNLSYLFVCISSFLWLLGNYLIISSTNENSAFFWARFAYFGITLIPPSMYFFSTAWLDLYKEKKKIVILNYILGSCLILLFLFTDLFITGVYYYFFGYFSRLSKFSIIYLICFFLISGAFFWNLFKGYKKEKTAIKKIQIKSVLIAFVIAFIGAVDFWVTFGLEIYPISFITMTLFIVIVAHSIIYYKLMDIETVLHKTALWLLSFSFIVIPVFLIYRGIYFYLEKSIMLQFIFWTASFVMFSFYLRVIQPKIDHFFQRREYNLRETLNKFVEELVYLKGLDNLISQIENTIRDTLYPQTVDIFIYSELDERYIALNNNTQKNNRELIDEDNNFLTWLRKNNKIVYKEFIDMDPQFVWIKEDAKNYFNYNSAVVVIPLILNNNLLGIINLGKKQNLMRYKSADFDFLNVLRNESVIAISNSLLYEYTEEQVKQRSEELIKVQKQLVQAEKLATVGTLAGGVAHEINNPLAAILTNVQLLLDSDDIKNKDDKESLELIEEATKRCREIVKKLMVYARKPLAREEISKVDLNEVIGNVLSFIKYQLGQEDIKIVTNLQKNNYFVTGNKNELEHVITNIVLNAKDAIKKIKKSGIIEISLTKSEEFIKIQIKDEGVGMSSEVRPKIFDPFFTTKDVGKGLGLGLSICQAIIERHNGKIEVESEINKGAVFTVQLPIA